MREILFRGQTRRKGEKVRMDGTPVESNWVYGGIFPNNDGGDFAIIYQQEPEIEKFPVYAETVCQYTGLTDKNGRKIFENDVIRISGIEHDVDGIYRVVFDEEDYEWGVEMDSEFWYAYFPLSKVGRYREAIEVIGNIFDNPDLITS